MSHFVKILVIVLVSALLLTSAAAQDDVESARTKGKNAYEDGSRLIERDTADDTRSALAKFRESARIYGELGDEANVASALVGVGLALSRLGDQTGAIETYRQAIPVFEKYGLDELHGRALYNLGRVYAEIDDNDKALEFHLKALRYRRMSGDKFGEAHTLNGVGLIYSTLGERRLALDYHTRALRIFTTLGKDREVGIVLNNIGLLYSSLGDERLAIEYLNKSLAARNRAGDRDGEAITLNNLGLVYSDSDPAAALGKYRESAAIVEKLGYRSRLATIYGNFSAAHLRLGEIDRSVDFARKSIELHRAIGNKSGEATSLNNLGQARLRSNMTPEAVTNLTDALALARESREKALEAIILGNLMRAYRESDSAAAVFYGKQSINLYQEMRAAIRDLDNAARQTYLRSIEDNYRQLADILIDIGRFADAQVVLAMLKEEEFSKFVLRSADETKSLSKRVSLSQREQTAAAKLEKLSTELSGLRTEIEALDRVREMIGALTAEDAKKLAQLNSDLDRANAEFRRFMSNELSAILGKLVTGKIDADADLQARVLKFGRDTAIISTIVTDRRYRVILTTADKQVAGKTEIAATDLNRRIFEFRDILKKPSTETRVAGKQLYDILVKPIEAELIASGAKTLVWSLDGALRYIPLAALSPDGSAYMVEKYRNVVLTPQTRDEISDARPVWKALGMGVTTAQKVVYPDYPDEPVELEALPAIEEELKAIVRQPGTPGETGILEGRRFLNDEFTIDSLTKSLGNKEFSVVHLASHFRLAPNWSDSFLLIGRGEILTLEKLNGLASVDFSNVDLVTLSACNTAGGDESAGREIDGLAGVIQLKNGKSVLATLWEVEDASTAELMSGFYRSRSSDDSTTKAAALQRAQLRLINGGEKPVKLSSKPAAGKFQRDASRPLAHPAYWAAFVLIGNWQ